MKLIYLKQDHPVLGLSKIQEQSTDSNVQYFIKNPAVIFEDKTR